jgi:hypothetical protein
VTGGPEQDAERSCLSPDVFCHAVNVGRVSLTSKAAVVRGASKPDSQVLGVQQEALYGVVIDEVGCSGQLCQPRFQTGKHVPLPREHFTVREELGP